LILHVDFLESIAPGLSWICRTLLEYVYPKGFLTRRVNNSGDLQGMGVHSDWVTNEKFAGEPIR